MKRENLVKWLEYFYTKDVERIPNHGTATDAYKEIWVILKKEVTEEMISKDWLPTAKNINALPEPVRDYIDKMQINADPPSMVADNIILRDTVKALEIKLEERERVA